MRVHSVCIISPLDLSELCILVIEIPVLRSVDIDIQMVNMLECTPIRCVGFDYLLMVYRIEEEEESRLDTLL